MFSKEFVFFFVKAVLLWISFFGYTVYLKRFMNSAFTPVFLLSSIGSVMFFAGLLNVMSLTVYITVFGGLILLLREKPWKKSFYYKNKSLFFVFFFFSAVSFLFLIRLYGKIPVHYDCFSHWLTVIREMFKTDSMPNFNSSLIRFQGYPTGSAGFVYFICKFLGNTRDDLVLFSQSLLYSSSLCVFFAFAKKKNISSLIVILTGSLFCLVANSAADSPVDSLLVDTLVSVISVAVVAIVIYYRKNLIKGIWLSLPLQIFLVAVKNSGILMVALNTGLIVFLSLLNDISEKKKFSFKTSLINIIRCGCLTAGIPAAVYLLWLRHVAYVFSSGTTSKHTASLENYAQTLTAKTPEQIKEILTNYFERFFSMNDTWLLLIVIFAIALFGVVINKLIFKKNISSDILVFSGICCAYFAFMAVLAVMYLLSMPYGEAVVLAAYDRYENTVLVYIVGCITVYCLNKLNLFSSTTKDRILKTALTLVFLLVLIGQGDNVKKLVCKTDIYTGSNRHQYEQLIAKEKIDEGKSYFVYGERINNDAGYNAYLVKYLLWSPSVRTCSPADFEKYQEEMSQYEYLIIMDSDEIIRDFLKENNVDPDKKVYRIKEVLQ